MKALPLALVVLGGSSLLSAVAFGEAREPAKVVPRAKIAEPNKPLDPTTSTADAKLNEKGRVIFYEKTTGGVALREGQDFGMMVFYDKYEEHPRPRYRVFLQAEHKIVRTESFADFTAALDRIPAGSKVFLFDLCTAGSHYGMPAKFMEDIRTAMEKRKLEVADPGYIICTCPK
jgi:hypothetical protein